MSDGPFLCSGCAKPLDLGEYRSCDCPTGVAFKSGTSEHIWKTNRCAWCDSIPIRAHLDGDDLCQACCEKWVRAEGFVDACDSDGSPKGGDAVGGSGEADSAGRKAASPSPKSVQS